jgi:Ca2+-transporting ATPase
VISITSAVAALLIFWHYFTAHNNPVEGRSLVFASFAVNSMIYIFAYRSMRRPLYHMTRLNQNMPLVWAVLAGLLTVAVAFVVPPLRNALGIVPLSLVQWGLIAAIAFALLIAVEIGKWISHRIHRLA